MAATELFPVAPRVGILGEAFAYTVPAGAGLCRTCGFAYSADDELTSQFRIGNSDGSAHVTERGHAFVHKMAKFTLKIGQVDFVDPTKSVRFWLEALNAGTGEWLFAAGWAEGNYYQCGPGKKNMDGSPIVWPAGMPGFTVRGIDHAGQSIRPRVDVPVQMMLGAQVDVV